MWMSARSGLRLSADLLPVGEPAGLSAAGTYRPGQQLRVIRYRNAASVAGVLAVRPAGGSGHGCPELAQDGRRPGRVLQHPPVAEPVKGDRPGAGPLGGPGR